jgi:predicted ArsR family transcriptional regulator
VSKEWDPDTVFDVFGSEVARDVLALASIRPVSADEIAEHCDVSEPTVYRRLNALQEYDMLAEETAIGDDGHHYKRYRTCLEEVRVRVDEGQFDIDLELNRDYTDKFAEFWDDLEKGVDSHAAETGSALETDSSTDFNGVNDG